MYQEDYVFPSTLSQIEYLQAALAYSIARSEALQEDKEWEAERNSY